MSGRPGAALIFCLAGMLRAECAISQTPGATAFVNVSVIPMDRDHVLRDQTVVVQGDRIVALGPATRVPVPAGAIRIDGRGKFLLPGLADMHVHLRDQDTINEASLLLFVANGVTTVRDMHSGGREGRQVGSSSPHQGQKVSFDLRRRVAAGELIGPRIYTAGDSDRRLAEAAQSVSELKADGHEFIKISLDQSKKESSIKPRYDSLVAAAQRAGLRIAGHVPAERGLEGILQDRWASIEHLTGYYGYLLGGYDPSGFFGQAALARRLADTADWMRPAYRPDPQRLRTIAVATKEAGVWNCPTLKLWHYFDPDDVAAEALMRPSDPLLARKLAKKNDSSSTGNDSASARFQPLLQLAYRLQDVGAWMIKALQQAGAGLLLGTDVGDGTLTDVPPGFGVVTELKLLVKAGLTPYQALAMGTRNVAAFMGTLDSTGTVAVGKRADLVLLRGNPVQDMGRIAGPAGVMVGGRWLSRADIDARLDSMKTWRDFDLRGVRRVMWEAAVTAP